MTATFGTDIVDKTNQAKVNACKARLDQAIKAAEDLESHVRWLVKERAWETLGYPNLSEMWEAHSGHKCPTHVQAIAVDVYRREGMNTRKGVKAVAVGYDGHTPVAVAEAVGLPVHRSPVHASRNNPEGKKSAVVGGMIAQLDHGVPPERVVKDGASGAPMRKTIERYGDAPYAGVRRRQHPRRTGIGPTELVQEGMHIPRQDADLIAEIARNSDVPKAEIYRQAVAEFLARYRESSESRPDVAS